MTVGMIANIGSQSCFVLYNNAPFGEVPGIASLAVGEDGPYQNGDIVEFLSEPYIQVRKNIRFFKWRDVCEPGFCDPIQ